MALSGGSGTPRIRGRAACSACGQPTCRSYNWQAHRRACPALFSPWRALRHGTLHRCGPCMAIWYLDVDNLFLTLVAEDRMPLMMEWDRGPVTLPADAAAVLGRIGATPTDLYGNEARRRLTPCEVVTHSGEMFRTAMICVQRDAPVDPDRHFRLGSEIARIAEGPFTLPLGVRQASGQAPERRMGFAPCLIEMPDARRFALNGTTSFMIEPGYDARQARLVMETTTTRRRLRPSSGVRRASCTSSWMQIPTRSCGSTTEL